MKFFAVLLFVAAELALAKPMRRGQLAHDAPYQTFTQTTYTTAIGDLAQPTTIKDASDVWWPWWNHWHGHGDPWPKVAGSQSTLSTSTCTSTQPTSSSAQTISSTTVTITPPSSSSSSSSATSSTSTSETSSSTGTSSSSSSSSSTASTSSTPVTSATSVSSGPTSTISTSGSSSSSSSTSSSSTSTTSTSTPSSSSSATSTSSTAAAPTVTQVLSEYAANILEQHNIHRRNSSVLNMTWSDNMASIADEIAHSCVYAHNTSAGGGGYGQNIGAGSMPDQVPALITNSMYNGEIELYPGYGIEPDMSNFEAWGHYSQIVWKASVEVGCATVQCDKLQDVSNGVLPYFTVCNYYPSGNVDGAYAANVLEPGDLPTVTVPA